MVLVLRILGCSYTLVLYLSNRTNDRGRRNLCGPAQNSLWGAIIHHSYWRWISCYSLLVNIFHMSFQVCFLFKFLLAEVATVLVVSLSMDPYHVATKTTLALELFEADITVIMGSLMFSLNMHVSSTTRSENQSKKIQIRLLKDCFSSTLKVIFLK